MLTTEPAPGATYAYPEAGAGGMSYGQGTMADCEPCGMMGAGMRASCGGGMMGPGMMAHHGGMMGGMMGGMGSGMMGNGMMRGYAMGPIMELDLTDAQRAQVNKISDGLRQEHWAAMGQIMQQQSRLRDLYASDQPDPKQVGDTYGAIAKIRQGMVVAQVKAHNDAVAMLNNNQREQLKRIERGEWGPTGSMQGPGQMQQGPSPPSPASPQGANRAPSH